MADEKKTSLKGRPYMGVMFDCCKVYVRIYQNKEGSHYRGRCPRCLRQITFVVGVSGEKNRFWRAK